MSADLTHELALLRDELKLMRAEIRALSRPAPAPSKHPRLTIAETAAELRCHPRTVRTYVATGRLTEVRLTASGSSRALITRESIEALLRECTL